MKRFTKYQNFNDEKMFQNVLSPRSHPETTRDMPTGLNSPESPKIGLKIDFASKDHFRPGGKWTNFSPNEISIPRNEPNNQKMNLHSLFRTNLSPNKIPTPRNEEKFTGETFRWQWNKKSDTWQKVGKFYPVFKYDGKLLNMKARWIRWNKGSEGNRVIE